MLGSPPVVRPAWHRVLQAALRRSLPVALVALLGATLLAFVPDAGARTREGGSEPRPARRGSATCKRHLALDFLKRGRFVKKGMLEPEAHNRALRWRVEKYGRIPGVPFEKSNPKTARSQTASTTFFGLPVQVHQKIVPALRCVEQRIQNTCRGKGQRYEPRAIGGFRDANTYRGGEVSNHLFGIAIDIDPDRNPCCGCVKPWTDHPACRPAKKGERPKTVWDKTALPRCWVEAFEKHGFYWLGRDALEDTMHFEYLADPDRRR